MSRVRPCPCCAGLHEHKASCPLLRIVREHEQVKAAEAQLARARQRQRQATRRALEAGANAALVGEVLGMSRQAVESYMRVGA